MKKILLFLLSIGFCGSVLAEGSGGIGGYMGFTSPADLGDGEVYGLYLDYDVNPNMRCRMGFGYLSGFDVENYDSGSFIGQIGQKFGLDDIDIVSVEMGGIFKFNPIEDVFSIYFGAGIAAYYISDIVVYGRNYREDTTIEFDPTVGFWGCAGLEVGHPNFKFFLEVKGTWAKNSSVNIAVEDWCHGYYGDVKIDLTNVQTLAGVKFVF